jgi:hypothetical protein
VLHRFPPRRDFRSLSVAPLLDVRDAFHAQLLHYDHVVGTAIGLYRIRASDPDAAEFDDPHDLVERRLNREQPDAEPRTLENSVVRPWSWPCILVFVDQWLTPKDVQRRPDAAVPPFLYHGSVAAPTCVVLVTRDDVDRDEAVAIDSPAGILGGGRALISRAQGVDRVGSAGCIVRDGDTAYVLTNQHVAGPVGQPVEAILRGKRIVIGKSHHKQVRRVAFSDVYPDFAGQRSYSNLDAGLVELSNIGDWSADVYGLGTLGDPIDLNTETITLDLIGCPVRAHGAASGDLAGEIHALFYRYRSLGGFDYIADLLIGPPSAKPARRGVPATEARPLTTRHGDSGTIWVWDPPSRSGDSTLPRPIAIQWGGQIFVTDATKRARFALASALSSVCRHLDVEVVRDWNVGQTEYWGAVGHYKIGFAACGLVVQKELKQLMLANQDRIAITDAGLLAKGELSLDRDQFVPLADVPDLLWRMARRKDQANHFADIDLASSKTSAFKGKTLLQLYTSDKKTLNEATWTEFYEAVGVDADDDRGALPFRVKQIYLDLVDAAARGDTTRFIAGAGILAHYVGDACQPLHASYLHHGEPGANEGAVHSDYETSLLAKYRKNIVADVQEKSDHIVVANCFTGGQRAAEYTMNLMKSTLKMLPPAELVAAWRLAKTGGNKLDNLWASVGGRTTDCMAHGAEGLALLWESAWREGRARTDASALKTSALGAADKQTLMDLYGDPDGFIPSMWLREMRDAVLTAAAAATVRTDRRKGSRAATAERNVMR